MKTKKVVIEFKCDRCGTSNERNINKDTGTLFTLDIERCDDMHYGNSFKSKNDLCQKCSNKFILFMEQKD